MAADILVIDDEADISSLISDILTDEKYAVRTANNSDRALKALAFAGSTPSSRSAGRSPWNCAAVRMSRIRHRSGR